MSQLSEQHCKDDRKDKTWGKPAVKALNRLFDQVNFLDKQNSFKQLNIEKIFTFTLRFNAFSTMFYISRYTLQKAYLLKHAPLPPLNTKLCKFLIFSNVLVAH